MEQENVRRQDQQAGGEAGMEAMSRQRAASEADAAIEERAGMLMSQAQAIAEVGGPDMLEAFRLDPMVREKVLSGEWDFQVAYGYLLGRESAEAKGRRNVPAAVRSPNSANTRKSISGMSDKEFDALDERLSKGEVIDPGR